MPLWVYYCKMFRAENVRPRTWVKREVERMGSVGEIMQYFQFFSWKVQGFNETKKTSQLLELFWDLLKWLIFTKLNHRNVQWNVRNIAKFAQLMYFNEHSWNVANSLNVYEWRFNIQECYIVFIFLMLFLKR